MPTTDPKATGNARNGSQQMRPPSVAPVFYLIVMGSLLFWRPLSLRKIHFQYQSCLILKYGAMLELAAFFLIGGIFFTPPFV